MRPLVERQSVMRREIFDVPNAKIALRQMSDNFGERGDVAAWENILFDPTVNGALTDARDRVQEREATRLEQRFNVSHKLGQMSLADMLDHPDADDIIELLAGGCKRTEIHQPDFCPVL